MARGVLDVSPQDVLVRGIPRGVGDHLGSGLATILRGRTLHYRHREPDCPRVDLVTASVIRGALGKIAAVMETRRKGEPERVPSGVLDGFVTQEQARDDCGVMIRGI
jgi:hypothetical protein